MLKLRRRETSALGIGLDAIAGVAGGIFGSWAIGKLMQVQQKFPEPLRGPEMKANPAEVIIEEGERLTGKQVPEAKKPMVGQALHYLYGTMGPAIFGLVARKAGLNRSVGRTLAFGAGLGVLQWAIGYLGWLPQAGVVEPVHRQGANHVASSVLGHAAYGVLAALPVAASGRLTS